MNEFMQLVREMRNAQKEYFKTRDKNVLQRSKRSNSGYKKIKVTDKACSSYESIYVRRLGTM